MAAAISFLQTADSATDATEYTFASQNLGAAASDRAIIVGVHARKLGGAVSVAVTVGGVSATSVVTQWGGDSNDNVSALFIAEVPTGTTGDVVVTFGAGVLRCGIGMWRATGIDTTAFDTGVSVVNPMSTTIDIEAGGVAVGASTVTGNTGSTAWTGLTEVYDQFIAAEAAKMSGAHDSFVSAETAWTVTATDTGGANPFVLVVASWSEATTSLFATADGTITDVVDEADTTVDLFASIDDDPDTPSDTDWINNAVAAGQVFFDVTDLPADFGTMDTAEIVVRYRGQNFGTGTVTLFAQLFQSDETTALSNEVQVAQVTGDGAFASTSAVTFTGLNTTAGKSVWDAARVRFRWATT